MENREYKRKSGFGTAIIGAGIGAYCGPVGAFFGGLIGYAVGKLR
jgi:hypothetical protein